MKNILLITIILLSLGGYSQEKKFKDWEPHETEKYKILKALAEYVNKKETNEISNDTLFKKYVYFDYVLNDTLKTRREKRLQKFDTLFTLFRKPIDSLGIDNLDAKPIRFFKEHKIYESFEKELKEIEQDVFVYFKKEKPDEPLRCLLFERETNKLLAWVLISQGSYKYFLTFNLF